MSIRAAKLIPNTDLVWTLKDGVLTIYGSGDMPDWSNSADIPWYFDRTEIESAVIISGITGIGDYAFSGCSALTSITIPDGVTSIGYGAFNGCSALTSITIPDSVTSIGDFAFYNCNLLANVYYGGSAANWYDFMYGTGNEQLLRIEVQWVGVLAISEQPTDAFAAEDEWATASVKARGNVSNYVWYVKDPGGTWEIDSSYTGSSTYSCTMTEDTDGRQVYCVITDAYGNQVTTNTVTFHAE